MTNGPPPGHASQHSSKKQRMIKSIDTCVLLPPAPSKKIPITVSPSALSDDDIVLIKKPSAELMCQFSKKAPVRAPCDNVHMDGESASGSCRPDSSQTACAATECC